MLKRDMPVIMSSFVGFVVMMDFFFKQQTLNQWSNTFQNWGIIVAAFALGLASINLARVHVFKVYRREQGWFTSVILLFTLVLMSAVGIVLTPTSKLYVFWFDSVYNTCHSAVGSLLAFYVASSAFRAFRMRNVEATLMLTSAFICMLGQAPIGELMYKGLPGWQKWIMDVINMSGQRGIVITAGIGAIAASLRVLLGLERGQLTGSGS